jgi:hypothetical protein
MEENQFKSENEELLEVVIAEGGAGTEPRRNTKKDLIGKIKTLCQDHEITLTESDTTLQRSSKVKLQKLLAAKTEALIEKKMKHTIRNQHIEDSECAREHMAVATLQYGLTVLNKMIDRGANTILPRAGYKLDGFCEAFDDERTKNEVHEILLCICRENPEIISHISNPYARLAIVYVGAVSMTLKKNQQVNKHASLGPRPATRVQAVRAAHGRQPAARKKLPVQPPVPTIDEEKGV